jgi:hypothetical protein
MIPFSDDEPIEDELQRTVPRPRGAFAHDLETVLLDEFRQTRKRGKLTMTLSNTIRPGYRPTITPAQFSVAAAAALIIVAGIAVFSRLLPPEQALSVVPLSQPEQAQSTPDCLASLTAEGTPAPLTETLEPWRIALGCRIIVIDHEQIEFTSNDLQTGDIVTVSEVRFEGDNALEPLTTDARLIAITSQPGDFDFTGFGLLVRDNETRIAELVEGGSRFAILETLETGDTRPALVYVPFASAFNPDLPLVLESADTSAALRTCATVDVIGLWQSISADGIPAGIAPPLPELVDLGRNARAIAAPLGELGGWLLQMRDPDEAVVTQGFLFSGGLLYLQSECAN